MVRIKSYVGPGITIKPEQLSLFDNSKWAIESKYDGYWSVAKFNDQGILTSIHSRTGTTFDKSDITGLIGSVSIFKNCELVGELEAGTQAANAKYAKLKYRRINFFDAIKLMGENIKSLTYEQRRKLLELLFTNNTNRSLLLAEQRTNNFVDFYNEITTSDDACEGVVLKRLDSKYISYKSDGKVDFWIRAKNKNTVDYYVMGLGLTPGGNKNLDCGLWNGNEMVHVLHVTLPKGYKPEEFVGKVIECSGWEIMNSGALRSAQFVRIRFDKTKEMCHD